MSIWDWINSRKGKVQKGQPVRVISFEPLEPRLLLSGDLIGSQPLLGPVLPFAHEDPGLPVDEQAIVVKLNQEDGGGAIDAGSDIAQAAGDLDLTFSFDGKTTTHFGIYDGDDYALGIAIQPDGKIVAVGESWNGSNWDFGLARYNTNGSLDTTFSGDGILTTDFRSGDDAAWGVAIQADGKIVVAGWAYWSPDYDFALARYNTDGTLDTTFSGDGKTTTHFGIYDGDDYAYSIAIQPDGKIVVAGYSWNGSDYDFALARYNTNGSLDTTFSADGILTTNFYSGTDVASAVALQADGKIVAAGWAYYSPDYDFALARYNTDGTLDTTFSGDGKTTTHFGIYDGDDYAFGMAIQPDGKIVAVGESWNGSNGDFGLARYNTNGDLDTTFSADGILTTDFYSGRDAARGVTLQSDGKIVVAGQSWNGSNDDFGLARYNTNGSLDTTFSADGILTTDFHSGDDVAFAVALQADGKIVVAGYDYWSPDYDFALARYDAAVPTPEITVLGNGLSIIDGDTTPSTTDGTDFGSVPQGGTPVSHTFTVRNDGTGTLTLGTVNVPGGFTVTDGLVASLAPGAWDNLTVQLDTGTAGTKAGDVSFSNNDGDENPFNFRITGTVVTVVYPEITVLGNGLSIIDGDTTPSTTDGTDFGSVPQGGTPVSHTFTVRNDGTGTLTLGTVNVPGGFTVTDGLVASLAPGAWDTFTVRLDTGTAGTKAGDVSFSNDDGDENPFNFRITGTVVTVVYPEITVLGNGLSIIDGDTTPSTTDGTDFGSVPQGGTPVSHTFTVRNDGTGTLTLGTVNVPGGFTVTDGLVASLAPGAWDNLTVQLDTGTAGTKAGDVSFSNNDGDENPFNFRITGTVTTAGSPEITVLGNGLSITDGDTTPSTTDDTNFGSVAQGDVPISHVFTVRNDGGGTLTLGAVNVPTGFTLTEGLSTSLAGGASDTFTVQLDTATAGTKVGTLYFACNDANEGPNFSFRITGTVTSAGNPEITVSGNSVSIADGDVTPSSSDDTDFGAAAQGGAPISRTFTVRNDGTATLTLGTVTVPTGFTLTEGLAGSLAAGASDTFTVRLDTATIGTKSGDVSFSNNDSDENPFNFRITGTVTTAGNPEITVLGNGLSITDGDTTPSTTDDTNFGSVVQGSAGISHTFTVRNDGAGLLTLGAVNVPTGFTLTEGLVGSLAAGASDTFTVRLDTVTTGTKTGTLYFACNDASEGPNFSFRITGTVTTAGNPEITVLGNGVSITDGDSTPSTTDDTSFGSVAQGGTPISHTFTVRNDGTGTLTLGAVTVPTGFTLTESLVGSLAAGASDTFTVQLNTATTGTKVGTLYFACNDANEGPNFSFRITGTVTTSGNPEITVLGNGVSITDGDTTPSTTDHTDFGSVALGGTPISRTFTVRNDGTGTLTLGSVNLPTGFTLTEGLVGSLAAGASDTFTIRLDTATAGTKVGTLYFACNDANEGPNFSFRITGTVV